MAGLVGYVHEVHALNKGNILLNLVIVNDFFFIDCFSYFTAQCTLIIGTGIKNRDKTPDRPSFARDTTGKSRFFTNIKTDKELDG